MTEESYVSPSICTSKRGGEEIVIILEKTIHKNGTYCKVVNFKGHQYVVNYSFLHPLLEGELFNRMRKAHEEVERLKEKVKSLRARNTRLRRRKN